MDDSLFLIMETMDGRMGILHEYFPEEYGK